MNRSSLKAICKLQDAERFLALNRIDGQNLGDGEHVGPTLASAALKRVLAFGTTLQNLARLHTHKNKFPVNTPFIWSNADPIS
jgi:hypothetical protein